MAMTDLRGSLLVAGPRSLKPRHTTASNLRSTVMCTSTNFPQTPLYSGPSITPDQQEFMLREEQAKENEIAQPLNIQTDQDLELINRSVIRSGVLFKQGKGGFFHRKNWKTRHVVLTGNSIKYYAKEGGSLKGVLDVSECNDKSIELMPKDSKFDGKNATLWRFALQTKSRRMIFSAETEVIMKDWIRSLRIAFALRNTTQGRFTETLVDDLGLDEEPVRMMRRSSVN